MRIELESGKYTYIAHSNGATEALRFGQPWRDLTGDKFVHCLAAELTEARAKLTATAAERDERLGDAVRESINVKSLKGQVAAMATRIEQLESALEKIAATPSDGSVRVENLQSIASQALLGPVEPTVCKHCNGNGISEISDPCICHYEKH